MKVISTNQQVENKQIAKIVDVPHSAASKIFIVQISKKNAVLKRTVKADTISNITETKKTEAPAPQINAKVEKVKKQATVSKKIKTNEPQDIYNIIKSKQNELKQVAIDLIKVGISEKEISKTLQSANRKANANIAVNLKLAYKTYRKRDIDRNEFLDRLYGTVVMKLDGIVSGLNKFYDQKIMFSSKKTELNPT